MAELFIAETDADIDACFPAYLALRPHLKRERFVAQVRRQQAQGFRILALRDAGIIPGIAGFRLAEFTAWGRIVYIDDLSTLPDHRLQGHGGRLLDWIADHARSQGCVAVHLDTGYARHAAHRLYLDRGYLLSSHHMSLSLAD
jgi:GNAT superfamily N-acetyltransferase